MLSASSSHSLIQIEKLTVLLPTSYVTDLKYLNVSLSSLTPIHSAKQTLVVTFYPSVSLSTYGNYSVQVSLHHLLVSFSLIKYLPAALHDSLHITLLLYSDDSEMNLIPLVQLFLHSYLSPTML